MAIIGILVGLLLPAVQASREAARRMSCSNNLKQIGLSIHNYESTNRRLPIGWNGLVDPIQNTTYRWSYLAGLLPYLEQGNTYSNLNLSLTLYPPGGGVPPRPEHQAIIATVIPTYLCPSDRAAPMANANNCSNAVPAAVNRFVASRGRLWAGQAYENTAYNHFFAPNSERYDCYFWVAGGFKAARSNHTAGVQTTLLDGSVRFVAETIDITVWRAVATRGGTEVINCTQW